MQTSVDSERLLASRPVPHAGGTANPDSETVLGLLRADSTLTAGGTEPVQWCHASTEARAWDDETDLPGAMGTL